MDTSEQEEQHQERKKNFIRRAAYLAGALGVGAAMWKGGRRVIHGNDFRLDLVGKGQMKRDLFSPQLATPKAPKPPRAKTRKQHASAVAEDWFGGPRREDLAKTVREREAREAAAATAVANASHTNTRAAELRKPKSNKGFQGSTLWGPGTKQRISWRKKQTQAANDFLDKPKNKGIAGGATRTKSITSKIYPPSVRGTWAIHPETGKPAAVIDAHHGYHQDLTSAIEEMKQVRIHPAKIGKKKGTVIPNDPIKVAEKWGVQPHELTWSRTRIKKAHRGFMKKLKKAHVVTSDELNEAHRRVKRNSAEPIRPEGVEASAKQSPIELVMKARRFLFEMRSKKDGKFRDENQVAAEQQSPKQMQDAYHKPSVLQRAAKFVGKAAVATAGVAGTAYLVGKTDAGRKFYGDILESARTGVPSNVRERAAAKGADPKGLKKALERMTANRNRLAQEAADRKTGDKMRRQAEINARKTEPKPAKVKTEVTDESPKVNRSGLVTTKIVPGSDMPISQAKWEGETRAAFQNRGKKAQAKAAAKPGGEGRPRGARPKGVITKNDQGVQAWKAFWKIPKDKLKQYGKSWNKVHPTRNLVPGTKRFKQARVAHIRRLWANENAEEYARLMETGGRNMKVVRDNQ